MALLRYSFDRVNLIVIAVAASVLSMRSLEDVDLGWHVAAGLWMIENAAFPQTDFLGALDRPWVSYSWLFELILGLAFRLGGFFALLLLQASLIALSVLSLLFLYRSLSKSFVVDEPRAGLGEVLVVLLAINFLAPFCHLRPQLLSACFLAWLFILLDKDRLPFLGYFAFVTLWANIHVFWIFGPVIYGAFGIISALQRREKLAPIIFRAALLSVAGILTPYGVQNVEILWHYGVKHQTAARLIDEFQSLGPSTGYVFFCFIGACLWHFCSLRRWTDFRRHDILCILCALLSCWQRKYLLLFSVCFVAAMAVKARADHSEALRQADGTRPETFAWMWAFVGSVLLFLVAFQGRPLPEYQANLFEKVLEIRQFVPSELHQPKQVVLNAFDDGGWLALFFWLSRKPGERESLLRTSIDGRTLVMGENRLQEYETLLRDPARSCHVLELWRPAFAILSPHSSLAKGLFGILSTPVSGESLEPGVVSACGVVWRIVMRSPEWIILEQKK